MIRTALSLVLVSFLAPRLAHAQGIPAVSGVLEVETPTEVPAGVPPVMTLRTPDRPSVFFASCTFGKDQTLSVESDVIEAGKGFVVALPADITPPAAECAVVARFANGLSERRPVQLRWTVAPPLPAEPDKAPKDAPKTAPKDAPKASSKPEPWAPTP